MATPINEIMDTKKLVATGLLSAADGFMATPPELLSTICNGCGAADAKFDFVPDTIYGLCVCAVCHIHDFGYHIGTSEQDRHREDDRFLMNLIHYINFNSNWLTGALRRRRALKYYEAVREFGGDAFNA